MAKKKLSRAVVKLFQDWGRKGGSRATTAQKNAARANLEKTPNHIKSQLTTGRVVASQEG